MRLYWNRLGLNSVWQSLYKGRIWTQTHTEGKHRVNVKTEQNTPRIPNKPSEAGRERVPLSLYYLFLKFTDLCIWPHPAGFGILAPRPGIKPAPPAMEAQSLNHLTAREVPSTPPPRVFRRNQPRWHSEFGLTASSTVRKHISVNSAPLVVL